MRSRSQASMAAVIATLLCFVAIAARADSARGTWNVYTERGSLVLETRWHSDDGHSNEDRSGPIDARALGIANALASSGQHGSFAMHRDAGDFAFDGWFGNGEASGSYTFTANEAFFDALRKRGYNVQTIDRKMGFSLVDMTLAYVDAITAEFHKAGGDQPDAHRLMEMKAVGVTPQYIEEIANNGYGHLTTREYVEFKAMGIDGAYLRKLADRGFKNLPARKVIAFKAMGIL